ncbi:hypothetical protein DICPUDRAFT_156555 [Dictyostelium purpureum]|uniref:Uncharacterized protein n=1 Tax=Dictyostelium purpureum TaxID=5786 RepID=F0ZWV9_DICPU|nr:uncharacterized protein DICPUDRAFT_156555 [Dictyostelium purpureum]EGC31559.1 hypothetical protein DICPUDRAFT_156555 [Dictyostelium purpureum]|eukprot:XP_003291901.1 hypothetical protein DICPUDRAFT_156555 [Dictyostelium purpureum]
MTLPNYLIEYILSYNISHVISNQIYNGSIATNLKADELVKYSLISKKIFGNVSSEIKERSNDEANVQLVQHLSGKEHGLVKPQDLVKIVRYYSDLQELQPYQYKMIILENIMAGDARTILQNYQNLPENIEVSLLIDDSEESLIDENGLFGFNNEDPNSKIKKLSLEYLGPEKLYYALKSNIKNISYKQIKPQFSFSICIDLEYNSNKISIDDLVFSPSLLGNNTERLTVLSSLNSLTFDSNVETMVSNINSKRILIERGSNYSDTNQEGADSQQVYNRNSDKDWQIVVRKLSNEATLKKLAITHLCHESFKCMICNGNYQGLDLPLVYKGIESILSNPFLVSVDLNIPHEELNQDLIQGFVEARSIKDLRFDFKHLLPIIKNVLSRNRNIRNIMLKVSNLEDLETSLQILSDPKYKYDVYSVSIWTNFENCTQVKELISKKRVYKPKEINIINLYYSNDSKPDYYKVSFNNTSVNLLYWNN